MQAVPQVSEVLLRIRHANGSWSCYDRMRRLDEEDRVSVSPVQEVLDDMGSPLTMIGESLRSSHKSREEVGCGGYPMASSCISEFLAGHLRVAKQCTPNRQPVPFSTNIMVTWVV